MAATGMTTPGRILAAGVAAACAVLLVACSSTVDGSAAAASRMAIVPSEPSPPDTAPPSTQPPMTDPSLPAPAVGPADADGPSSVELIDAAEQSGQIDASTAFVYRLLAQFGAPELPESFRGVRAEHNVALGANLPASAADAPAELREILAPYLARPADPVSAFNEQAQGFRSAASNAEADEPGPHRCIGEWLSEPSPDAPFRIWACADSPEASEAIATVSDALADLVDAGIFEPAPGGLGLPLPDDPGYDSTPGSDDRIDIYVLPEGWMAPYREGNERSVDPMAAAVTMPAAPRFEATSGYTMLAGYLLDHPAPLAGVLAHEITHLQQFAHLGIAAGVDAESAWFYEATADWARARYVPVFATGYLPDLQNSHLALHDPDWRHGYAASFWPLYLEQQFGPESIAEVWRQLAATSPVAPGGAAVTAIDELASMRAHFSEFVIRLANLDLPGEPVSPLFTAIDPQLPTDVIPDMTPLDVTAGPVTIPLDDVPGLGYRYVRLAAAPPGDMAAVEITGDAAAANDTGPTIDALVQDPDGSYRRVSVDQSGTTVCTGGDIILAVSHASLVIEDVLGGALTVTAVEDPGCGGEAPDADPAVDAAACDALRDLSLRATRYADLALLPVTSAEVDDDFAGFDPYYDAFPAELAEQVRTIWEAAAQAADRSAARAADILDDDAVRAASDYIARLYSEECYG